MRNRYKKLLTTLMAILVVSAVGVGWYWYSNRPQEEMSPVTTTVAPAKMYQSGPFRVGVEIEPLTPVVGDNRLNVILQNADGNPVADANFEAVATMPAMGMMAAMNAPADLSETAPGRYEGSFNLVMAGAWPLTLDIEKAGMGRTRISFDLSTSQRGLTLATGGRRLNNSNDPMGDMNDDMAGMDGMAMESDMTELPSINLDNRRRQLIGLQTGVAMERQLVREIRAVGDVGYDETRVSDVNLRFDAWIGDLYADYVGKEVSQDEVLFTVYGPDLLAAQQEYLEILRRRQGPLDTLRSAARKRLLLWDMRAEQIRELEARGTPLDYVPILAPRSGTVVEKNIVTGTAHKAGMTLIKIADLSGVWIDARVYDSELPLIQAGMPAEVSLPYLPGQHYQATVDYIYPYLEGKTRTARIRLALPNPDGQLKPGMYAEVRLQVDLGERLLVPESAVLFSGQERIVFVDLGDGRLQPRYIETGQRNKDYIEVISGLSSGESIVTSGNFLIDAETRLKTGIKQW